MNQWDIYKARLEIDGITRRERYLKDTKSNISSKSRNSLSCHQVMINGVEQMVTILNQRDNMSTKKICALPGEALKHGGLVDFAGQKWLITEVDANAEVYASGIMERCNHLLKWIDRRGELIKKWCIVEDGTKYLIGEQSKSVMTIGDSRIAVTIGKDKDTIELRRGKRFLIDDLDEEIPLAYQITKSNKLFNLYDGSGVFRFILNEVNMTDNDNVELRVADFYNWNPHTPFDNCHQDKDTTLSELVNSAITKPMPDDDKEVWL